MWWDKQYSMALRMSTSLKLWLIVKDAKLSEAHTIFQGSGIPITSEGNVTLVLQLGLNHLSIPMSVKKFLNGSLRLSFYPRYH